MKSPSEQPATGRQSSAFAHRHQVTVDLNGAAAHTVQTLRSRWDPVMKSVAPAHVTVTYPEEAVDEQLLLDRLKEATSELAPFSLSLGAILSRDGGRGGVFARIDDPAGGLEALRDRLLLPPQRFLGYPFHATIAHPRTATAPQMCWDALRGVTLQGSFPVERALWTVTDATARHVIARFPLRGVSPQRKSMVAAILVDSSSRVLLGWRRPDRAYMPGVWDLPGGHVESAESPRHALLRELQEELDIAAALTGPWRRIVDDDLAIDLTIWVVHQWRGTVTNNAPEEHSRVDWFDLSQIATLPVAHPAYAPLISEAIADRDGSSSSPPPPAS